VTVVTMTSHSTLFFFLNHKFITWCPVADHGSYFVTTLNKTKVTKEKEKERKKERKKEKD